MSLSASQRAHLERRLTVERAQALDLLLKVIAEQRSNTLQERAGDMTPAPHHPADLGTDTIDAELDVSNVTRISREIAEIDAALERFYTTPEQFGRSETTGQPIPFERLDLVPWARTRSSRAGDRS